MPKLTSRTAAVIAFALCSSTVGPLPSAAADSSYLQAMTALGAAHHHRLESELLGRGLHLLVRLPEGYEESSETRYPTVYLLDGGITFPLLASYYRYLSLAGDVPEAIVVGVSYGAVTFEEGNFRGADFTAPSEEREHYGGAERFQEVFRRELLPLVETTYRSDPSRRVIFGQSLGGQFVLFTAQTDPALFHGHIASNPALHRNLPLFLTLGADLERSTARVFVTSAEHDDPRFREPALRWIEHWRGRDSTPWELEARTLAGHNHFSAAPAAFRQGMLWLFPPETTEVRPAS